MKKLHIAQNAGVIALALMSIAACDSRKDAATPTTDTNPPSAATTPPVTPPPEKPPTISTPEAPGTMTSPSSATGSVPMPNSSLRGPRSITLANANPAQMRALYGVDVTRVADTKLSMGDRGFLKDAAIAGMYEVEMAKIAADRAQDPAVKSFAQKLVDQHTAANDELKQLAASRNYELPTELSMLKRRAIDKMRKDDAKDFDRDFVTKIGVTDHENDIKMFEKASKNAKDPDVKAWAAKTLPTLREHLAAAQTLPGAHTRIRDKVRKVITPAASPTP